jgi:GNAT superfamily N-acetyltransferase
MTAEIIEETRDALTEYEKVPIAFLVESRFRVELCEGGLGGMQLIEEPVAPYVKDYDQNQSDRPSQWTARWDISHWGILSAYIDGRRVGGAAVAWKTTDLIMLAAGADTACLWDLRVAPDWRGKSIGRQLFARAVAWAQARHCRRFIVETQNINVPACRFYARQGCELGAINRYAYDETLKETQLLWYRKV